MSDNKIFVQIASYRDPQLIPTIEDMIDKSKEPSNLVFGICWQHDETEDIQKYDNNPQFRVEKYHYSKSEGLGWARNITNKLYDGEKYTLQIDSHHRFVKNWDEKILRDYNQALMISEKPIITTYCTPFNPTEDESLWNQTPSLMSQYEFSSDRLLMSMPWYIQDYKQRKRIIRARTISGHFYFTSGDFIREVPYDPEIYFGGYTEETTLSVRAFTHGFDFFSPYEMIMWHEYTRNYRPKHWDDHGKVSETKKTSGERDIYARNKTRQLFGTEDYGIDMGIYSLGKKRTLRDYEEYGGFDFKKLLIQEYTLKVKEPPNPLPWEEQFNSKKYNITCEWDVEFFKKYEFENPQFLTFAVQSKSGSELYRNDFTIQENPEFVKLEKNKVTINIESLDKPSKIVMYLFDKNKLWSDRYEKII
jgi:glycosyltransferase involved in cell wall biosynthesis